MKKGSIHMNSPTSNYQNDLIFPSSSYCFPLPLRIERSIKNIGAWEEIAIEKFFLRTSWYQSSKYFWYNAVRTMQIEHKIGRPKSGSSPALPEEIVAEGSGKLSLSLLMSATVSEEGMPRSPITTSVVSPSLTPSPPPPLQLYGSPT